MSTSTDFPLVARDEDFSAIVEILRTQQGQKVDVVAPATKISLDPRTSELIVTGIEAHVDETGVMPVDGHYAPTDVFWGTMSEKLQIPPQYLRRMREQRPDLLAANVNGLLHGNDGELQTALEDGLESRDDGFPAMPAVYPPDSRKFLLRLFRGYDGGTGVARAMLSDTFRLTMDNLDVLTAALGGVEQAGVNVQVDRCDLTERRMYVRIDAPGVRKLAPVLLGDYKSPFAVDPSIKRAGGWSLDSARAAAKREGMGFEPGTEPVISAGLVITNSETGDGAYNLVPILKVGPCRNGLVIEVAAQRQVHLGARMDEGLIKFSEDTQRKELEVIRLRARDAVKTWLSEEFITAKISELEEEAGVPISNPVDTIETVTKGLQFSVAERESVLQHFILGRQITAGGIMNAVTSVAQTIEDPDRAWDVQRAGVPAMKRAAKLARIVQPAAA